MSIDVFALRCGALEGARLAGFKGVEGLSRPFEFDVFFTVPVGTDVRGAVGSRATLVADRDDGRGAMRWHGVLAGMRLLHETAERALYRASLVPRLWLLSHHVRSHVHTRAKIDAFAEATLKDGGLTSEEYAFHTDGGAYPQEEFVCQYRESHLDFVHRWFEREGLYYYFEHPEGEGAAERMVIVDDKAHHQALVGGGRVRYAPSAGADGSAGECLRELFADYRLLPASVLISDYNYANPSAPVSGEKAVSGAGQGRIREYGYRVFTEGEASRLAAVKAQSMACRELTVSAVGDALGLRAGYVFEVEDAPSELPSKYLAIEVRHAGAVAGSAGLVRRYTGLDQAETYRVEVAAIPSSVQYRAPQSTPWPRIYGFENGTVDGPAESQYAQIDDQGRYLVRFKFDTSELPDGSTSTYLRMMQPHGGTTEGWHFPLRKGTEVMVSFQGGDPDRPVIAGVVPNALTPSNVTRKNNRQNVVRSGGGNFLVMDDTENSEYIDMGTPGAATRFYMGEPDHDRNFIGPPEAEDFPPKRVKIPPTNPDKPDESAMLKFSYFMSTKGCAGFDVGASWWQHVGGGLTIDVVNESRIRYGGAHTFIVGGKADEYYKAGLMQRVTAGFAQHITGNGTQSIRSNWTHSVLALNQGHYGEWKVDVDTAWTVTAAGDIELTSTGGTVRMGSTAGKVTILSPTKITLVAPEIESLAAGEVVTKTPFGLEFFGTKNAVGIHQFNATAINSSMDGSKSERVGMVNSFVGVKFEIVGFQNSHTPVELSAAATKLERTASLIAQSGIRIYNAVLAKFG